jgi:hypothetical protein
VGNRGRELGKAAGGFNFNPGCRISCNFHLESTHV